MLEFDYPDATVETEIVAHGLVSTPALAFQYCLVGVAQGSPALRQQTWTEEHHLHPYAHLCPASLIRDGVAPRNSCEMTDARALTDDPDLLARCASS